MINFVFVPLLAFFIEKMMLSGQDAKYGLWAVGLFLIGVLLTVVGRFLFFREDAIAMVFGVVMRDLSIALAIAMTAFGKQGLTIALLISLAYIIQIQSAAWYVKFVNVMFGLPKQAAVAVAVAKVQPAAEKEEQSENLEFSGKTSLI